VVTSVAVDGVGAFLEARVLDRGGVVWVGGGRGGGLLGMGLHPGAVDLFAKVRGHCVCW
jgi:hypothetical protein